MADSKYGEASLRAREHFASKVKMQLNKNVGDLGLRLVKLTNLIPNWETYLTQKQLEAAHKYLKTLNAYDVDYQLKLSNGTTHQRLFGSKTSKGALGRLEDVYKKLNESGYFVKREEKKEALKRELQNKSKSSMSPKNIQKMKELIKLLIEMPEYERHLTKSQSEKVFHFMRLRNLRKVAEQCGVSSQSLQKTLIGEGGILDKLREVNNERTINSWEEI